MYTGGIVKCPYCGKDIIVSYDDEDGFSVGDMYADYVAKKINEANKAYHLEVADPSLMKWYEIANAALKLQKRISEIKTREEWLKGE